jgi:MFS transporter, FSR family, fosmidomycin resistance protein
MIAAESHQNGLSLGILFSDLGHCLLEFTQNMLPILIPLLVPVFGLSLAQVGLVSTVFQLTSSLVQPLVGRISSPYWMSRLPILGLAAATLLMSSSGLSPNYLILLALVGAAGLGCGAFHPHSSSRVWGLGGKRRATTLSVFNFAGGIGWAFGPLVATLILLRTGTAGTLWLAPPGIILALVWLALVRSGHDPLRPDSHIASSPVQTRPSRLPMAILLIVAILRSWTSASLGLFLPLYLVERHFSLGIAGSILTVLLILGSVAGLLGGYLADKTNHRMVMVSSMLLSVPLMVGFLLLPGLPGLVLLVLAYTSLVASLPVNQAMAQELLPARAAFASALIGCGMGLGGTAVFFTGWIADSFGLQGAFFCVAFIPVIAAGLAMGLPSRLIHPVPATEASAQ